MDIQNAAKREHFNYKFGKISVSANSNYSRGINPHPDKE